MEKISVIIPCYNSEKFLKHTVQSVIDQTYKDWELIIVDDKSTDNSLKEAQKLAETDTRIKIIPMKENGGVSVCRNLGMRQASGRYVAFLDSDDIWANDKLERQLKFMKKNNAAISHTGYAYMSENGIPLKNGRGYVDKDLDVRQYMKTTQINTSTVMFDTDKIKDLHFPEDRELCEDARAWMDCFRKGFKFTGLDEPLSMYRVRDNQLSQSKYRMAKNTFNRYMNEEGIEKYKSLYYFMNYAVNGVRKRKRDSNLDEKDIKKFNLKGRD